jgi:hypothetical protein
MTNSSQPAPARAVRLIFEYEGDQVRLVSQQRVDLAVTGFDLLQTMPPPGYYVEARGPANETLSRVLAHNAFLTSTEVFPEQPGEPITRIEVPQPRGAFTVVVPAPATADHVALVRVTPRHPQAPAIVAGTTSPVPGESERIEIASFQLEAGN